MLNLLSPFPLKDTRRPQYDSTKLHFDCICSQGLEAGSSPCLNLLHVPHAHYSFTHVNNTRVTHDSYLKHLIYLNHLVHFSPCNNTMLIMFLNNYYLLNFFYLLTFLLKYRCIARCVTFLFYCTF